MSVYPFEIDSDSELPRIDDNITELGGEAINSLRDAVFNIEEQLGITPAGTLNSLAEFLAVSFNANGTIKQSALTSVGLATLPIVDNQVADGAGIKEYKLSLDYSTSDLHTLIVSNKSLLDSLVTFANATETKLNSHIGGSPDSDLRHVGSHIDLNAVPSDIRDPSYVWGGLFDKNNVPRTAVTVAEALDQISTELVFHQNITQVNSPGAHPASAISVDGTNFTEISTSINDVQEALEALDAAEENVVAIHRATMHSNGIPQDSRSQAFDRPDGYGQTVVPSTSAALHVAHKPPGTGPVDDTNTGDEIISFNPDNANFVFDSQFSQVRVGDIARINYRNGLEASSIVESIRYTPGSEWILRISNTNLIDTDSTDGYADGYVRIDRPLFDTNVYGVMAVAAANAIPQSLFSGMLGSVIVGHPSGAVALGNGFDPNQLDATHYLLYLQLYPTGNPQDRIISLPGIDVTGNAGATTGQYTLERVIKATNDSLRAIGYNYRFIAFEHISGNFGIMLADAINGASFSIVNGDNSSGTLITGAFINNVVGNAEAKNLDALGFGFGRADLASPIYQATYIDSTAAQLPTKVIAPLKKRAYVVNGIRKEQFAPTYLATLDDNRDGYWPATLINRTPIGTTTVEVTYRVNLELQPAELKAGKTIVVQNALPFTDPQYNDVDYGRFIIKQVTFEGCDPGTGNTLITVINGIHGTGIPAGFSTSPEIPVNLYFSEDSVGFNLTNVKDPTTTATNYHRLHEIYVTDKGKTFSHERARMPIQSESASLLDTSKWHITDVSPKLRGYVDSVTLRKYLRLTIVSYSPASGEFDGYVGKPNPVNPLIDFPGILVTGRKNIPVRFYDDSGVDYIELIFRDEATVPSGSPTEGDAVMSSNVDRAVDIEMFPTITLDDELLRLATCEVNWSPLTGTDNIEYVKDRRPQGSISELEFTQSAKEFIQAGDRHLHANGVIRDLAFRAQSGTDSRVLFFNGGVALVDGAIVMSNSGSVTIPEIFDSTHAKPDAVQWAVCVDKFGHFVPIILTATKKQFFAQDNISGNKYYVPSVSFTELISVRKDLTIIAIVNVTIASLTVNSVKDARRFITNETMNVPFTWVPKPRRQELLDASLSPEDYLIGHFHSFEAMQTWVNNYGSTNNVIKVRGTQLINSTLNFVFSNPVTFEGENATFNVTAGKGITLGSDNISIKKINFTYNPEGVTYVSPISPRVADGVTVLDYVNANVVGGAGCIYTSGSRINIQIDECEFRCTLSSGPRPPFIHFSLQKGNILQRVYIRQNVFVDNSATGMMSAIAIINSNTGGSSSPADLRYCTIENNITDRDQSIIITSMSNANLDITIPGITANNAFIRGNRCGSIGQVMSSYDSKIQHGLTIENNNCKYIANLDSLGNFKFSASSLSGTYGAITHDSADIVIKNNSCNWIHCASITTDYGDLPSGTLLIDSNKLKAYDTAHLLALGAAITPSFTLNFAILTYGKNTGASDDGSSECRVVNNTTDYGIDATHYGATKYTYSRCCVIDGTSAIINSNVFRGIKDEVVASIMLTFNGRRIIATNNRLDRGTSKVLNYISNVDTNGTGLIVDNFFDKFTTDDVSNTSSVINLNGAKGIVAERNKNQTGTITLNTSNGNISIGLASSLGAFLGGDIAASGGAAVDYTGFFISNSQVYPESLSLSYITAEASGAQRYVIWDVSLDDVLPPGVEIVSGSLTGFCTAATSATSGLSLAVGPGAGSPPAVFGTPPIDFSGAYTPNTTKTMTASTINLGWRTGTGLNMRYIVKGNIFSNGDATIIIALSNAVAAGGGAIVTYRW